VTIDEAASCSNTQLEITTRKIKMAIITTGKTISKGIPGGEGIPMRNGPNRRMATMIQNMTMEP